MSFNPNILTAADIQVKVMASGYAILNYEGRFFILLDRFYGFDLISSDSVKGCRTEEDIVETIK